MSDPYAASTPSNQLHTSMEAPLSDGIQSGFGDGRTVLETPTDANFFDRISPLSAKQRNVLSLLLFAGTCLWFWVPLDRLVTLALESEHFSHALLIPWVSAYILFIDRIVLLTSKEWSPTLGMLFLGCGACTYLAVGGQDGTSDRLVIAIAAFVLMCWGIFLGSFGSKSFRQHAFALLFLLAIVPIPSVILDATIEFLQRSSAEVVDVLFSVLGIPVFREGFSFRLSNFSIQVAQECSGIRSFLSLVITSLLAGYWFLRSGWSKLCVVGFVVPLAIFKNACRIVGLALLANYVDPTYITNSVLHRAGGIPLFLLSLLFLFSFAWMLRQFEKRLGYGS
jgi:exosortase